MPRSRDRRRTSPPGQVTVTSFMARGDVTGLDGSTGYGRAVSSGSDGPPVEGSPVSGRSRDR